MCIVPGASVPKPKNRPRSSVLGVCGAPDILCVRGMQRGCQSVPLYGGFHIDGVAVLLS